MNSEILLHIGKYLSEPRREQTSVVPKPTWGVGMVAAVQPRENLAVFTLI